MSGHDTYGGYDGVDPESETLREDARLLIRDLMVLVESLSEDTRGGPFEDGENSIVDRARAFVTREFGTKDCPHGMPLAENICGPCSEGRPNRTPTNTFDVQSREGECICEHGPNGPPALRGHLEPHHHEFACPKYVRPSPPPGDKRLSDLVALIQSADVVPCETCERITVDGWMNIERASQELSEAIRRSPPTSERPLFYYKDEALTKGDYEFRVAAAYESPNFGNRDGWLPLYAKPQLAIPPVDVRRCKHGVPENMTCAKGGPCCPLNT